MTSRPAGPPGSCWAALRVFGGDAHGFTAELHEVVEVSWRSVGGQLEVRLVSLLVACLDGGCWPPTNGRKLFSSSEVFLGIHEVCGCIG